MNKETNHASSPHLSAEQQRVLKWVLNGKSVFYSGQAGTGKSLLLKEIIKHLPPRTTFVTALTGSAAVLIGGTTLHSFAGIGLGTQSISELIQKIRGNRTARANWASCKVLIIDEVSMLDKNLFEKLDDIARRMKCSDRPFGGIQLVLVGDFFQLPPVSKSSNNVAYCFEADCWPSCVPHIIILTQIFRQKEQGLISLLNELRFGRVSEQCADMMRSLSRPLQNNDGVIPTKLYSRNFDVDMENAKCLEQLQAEAHIYHAMDSGNEPYKSQLDKFFLAVPLLSLKVGAQVMVIKNLDQEKGIVNGSRGVVLEFVPRSLKPGSKVSETMSMDDKKLPRVRLADGQEILVDYEEFVIESPRGDKRLACRKQLPLKLAWSISIHKSQGMSIDFLEIRLDDCFAEGQAYVAISRARTLEGLRIASFNPRAFRTNPKVVDFYGRMREASDPEKDEESIEVSTHAPAEIATGVSAVAEDFNSGEGSVKSNWLQQYGEQSKRRSERKERRPRRQRNGWLTKPALKSNYPTLPMVHSSKPNQGQQTDSTERGQSQA